MYMYMHIHISIWYVVIDCKHLQSLKGMGASSQIRRVNTVAHAGRINIRTIRVVRISGELGMCERPVGHRSLVTKHVRIKHDV